MTHQELTQPRPLGSGPLAPFVASSNGNGKYRGNGTSAVTLRDATDEQLANALGWFSIGLGVVELFAPRALGRLVGAGSYSTLLPLLGAREVISGIGILANHRPAGWLWGRVAGDVIDLAFFAAAASARDANPARLSAAALAVAGVTALDVVSGERLTQRPDAPSSGQTPSRGLFLRHAITINRPADELYQAWRHYENLPRWMRHLHSVEVLDGDRTRWTAAGPSGLSVSWEAQVIAEQADHFISWKSLPGSRVDTSGSVRFTPAPAGRGSELRVEMTYNPPLGQVGAVVASLFGRSAEQEIAEDLRRFKAIMETGEAPRTHGQSHGKCGGRGLLG